MEALGIAGNNRLWQVTVKSAALAKQLVDMQLIFVGRQRAELSYLKAPGFKVRIFWLPFYVSSDEVKQWLEGSECKMKHERSAVEGLKHVATMNREVWITKAPGNINEKLPDTAWVQIGSFRHRVQVVVQGRPARCHKCSERGHM